VAPALTDITSYLHSRTPPAVLNSQIPLREKLFFRMIYETTTRPRGVLEARIELWNRTTGDITFS
jgi:hypothetical protein